jgi:hypothetical protein
MSLAERSGLGRWRLLAAILTALLVCGVAAATPEPSGAEICLPECLPPDEEGGDIDPNPAPPPVPKLLVVNLGWSTGSPATSAPLAQSTLDGAVAHLREVVNPWFRAIAPGFREWTVVRGGSYTIAPPNILSQGGCTILGATVDSFWRAVRESGDAAARANGFDLRAYDAVIYVWSPRICTFKGIKDKGSNRIGLPVIESARHELGHHLGLSHSRLLECRDANEAPAPPLTGTCFPQEYGDPFDTMGSTSHGLYNAIFQNALGWLKNQVVNVSAGDLTRSVTLKPLSAIGQSPRALRLVDGPATLWLEYRQPTGLEAPQFSDQEGLTYGVLVHREIDLGSGQAPGSYLLDVSPGTPAADSVIPVGQSWANPLGEMTIRVESATATGATVTLSTRRLTVPQLRGLTPTSAEAALAAAGLRSTGWGSVIDPTCTLIGLVAAQTPSAGARILPETPVSVSVGQKDPARGCQ